MGEPQKRFGRGDGKNHCPFREFNPSRPERSLSLFSPSYQGLFANYFSCIRIPVKDSALLMAKVAMGHDPLL